MGSRWFCEIEIQKLTPKLLLTLIKWAYLQEKKNLDEFTFDIKIGRVHLKEGSGPKKIHINITNQRLKLFSELQELEEKREALREEDLSINEDWERAGLVPDLAVVYKKKEETLFKVMREWPKELKKISAEYDKKRKKIQKEIKAKYIEYNKTHDCSFECFGYCLVDISFVFCLTQEEFAKESPEVKKDLMANFYQGLFRKGNYDINVYPKKIEIWAVVSQEEFLEKSKKAKKALLQLCKEIKPKRAVITHSSYDKKEREELDIIVYPRISF